MNYNKMMTIALMSVFLLTGCSAKAEAQNTESNSSAENSESASAETVKKTEVIAAVNSEPSAGWNPITGYGQRYDPILQSTLTKAYGGEITYDLATGYEVSEDGKDWTFTIRDDARYSNGEKVLASDVAFTYEAVRDNSTSLDLNNISSAEAIDDGGMGTGRISPCTGRLSGFE